MKREGWDWLLCFYAAMIAMACGVVSAGPGVEVGASAFCVCVLVIVWSEIRSERESLDMAWRNVARRDVTISYLAERNGALQRELERKAGGK